jgi:hypothetical protein
VIGQVEAIPDHILKVVEPAEAEPNHIIELAEAVPDHILKVVELAEAEPDHIIELAEAVPDQIPKVAPKVIPMKGRMVHSIWFCPLNWSMPTKLVSFIPIGYILYCVTYLCIMTKPQQFYRLFVNDMKLFNAFSSVC